LQRYHYAFYLGEEGQGRRVPDAYGLRELWETPSLLEVLWGCSWCPAVDVPLNHLTPHSYHMQCPKELKAAASVL
jgi:hypothetical protein